MARPSSVFKLFQIPSKTTSHNNPSKMNPKSILYGNSRLSRRGAGFGSGPGAPKRQTAEQTEILFWCQQAAPGAIKQPCSSRLQAQPPRGELEAVIQSAAIAASPTAEKSQTRLQEIRTHCLFLSVYKDSCQGDGLEQDKTTGHG